MTNSLRRITVVLVDDNQLVREGIASLVTSVPGFEVVGASGDVEDTLLKIPVVLPDIVLLDYGLSDRNSLTVTSNIHADVPALKIILMGLLPLFDEFAAYLDAGATAFIAKDASFEEFLASLQSVAKGQESSLNRMKTSVFERAAALAASKPPPDVLGAIRLTSREREVIDLLKEGLSNREIASRLNLAIHTVKSHVHNILEKLALRSRLEVVAYSHSVGKSDGSMA